MKEGKLVLRAVGVFAVAAAALGFMYNLGTIGPVLFYGVGDREAPYFVAAYVVMSAICAACYVTLLIFGIQFIRLRLKMRAYFNALLAFEAVYLILIVIAGLLPRVGLSIAGASGAANGGMMFQVYTLFPLWAPFAVHWAVRTMKREAHRNARRQMRQSHEAVKH